MRVFTVLLVILHERLLLHSLQENQETTKNDVYEQTLPYKENPLGVLTIWKSVRPLDAVYNLLLSFILTFVFNSLLRILVKVFKMEFSPSSMTASNRSRFSTL